jgi:UDP-N-acetyl-D-mannosaminuronic acid transferase (WecB/TagA/CpsF family)
MVQLKNNSGHKASISVNGRYLTMATFNRAKDLGEKKFITGVRTDQLADTKEAQREYEKLLMVMQSNGYKLTN